MLAKSKGAVGCAHCQKLGARQPCRSCGRPVCEHCHGRPTACTHPGPFSIALPTRSRVQAISRCGRGVVARARLFGQRAVDLRDDLAVLRLADRVSATTAQLLLPRRAVPEGRFALEQRLALQPVGDALVLLSAERRRAHLAICERGVLLAHAVDDLAVVIDLAANRVVSEHRMPAELIHSIALHGERGLLALGGHGHVRLMRVGERGRAATVGRWPIGRSARAAAWSGDVIWTALRAGQLAACTADGRLQHGPLAEGDPRSWPRTSGHLASELAPGYSWFISGQPDLSPDGQWIAAPGASQDVDGRVDVRGAALFAVQGDKRRLLSTGDDRPTVCSFVDGGRHLVVAAGQTLYYWPREAL